MTQCRVLHMFICQILFIQRVLKPVIGLLVQWCRYLGDKCNGFPVSAKHVLSNLKVIFSRVKTKNIDDNERKLFCSSACQSLNSVLLWLSGKPKFYLARHDATRQIILLCRVDPDGIWAIVDRKVARLIHWLSGCVRSDFGSCNCSLSYNCICNGGQ